MKPTKEYMAALAAEQSRLMMEAFNHLSGVKKMTDEEKAAWEKQREEISQKVKAAKEQV